MFLTDRAFTSLTWNLFISLSLPGLLYFVILCVRRVYFHPLSQFPGPRLAALSRWYEFYFDIIKGGTFSKQFPALHQKYGTLIPSFARFKSPFADELFRTNCSYFTGCASCERSRVLQNVGFRLFIISTESKSDSAKGGAESLITRRISSKLPLFIEAWACQNHWPPLLIPKGIESIATFSTLYFQRSQLIKCRPESATRLIKQFGFWNAVRADP